MITLSRLKQDLDANRNIDDIIQVFKTVAVIQFRSFQLKEKPNEDFFREVESCFSLPAVAGCGHPYFTDRPGLPTGIVVITSDEGFLGELNTALVNFALDLRKSKEDKIIVLGERGARYLEDANESFTFFPGFSDNLDYKQLAPLRDYLLKAHREMLGRILVVYPEFLSLTVQRVALFPFLPRPAGAKENANPLRLGDNILIEPGASAAAQSLIDLWSLFAIFKIYRSSKQSEYAARIMHLEESDQELTRINKNISFLYFKQIHVLRDKSIREISASKLLLEKQGKGSGLHI